SPTPLPQAGEGSRELCKVPGFTFAELIVHTTRTNAWMCSIGVDVGAVVPATLALLIRRSRHRQRKACSAVVSEFLGDDFRTVSLVQRMQIGARNDQHEFKIIAQAL